MSNSNLGLGIIIGAGATFLLGKYLLSDEGAEKTNALLEKVKQDKKLKEQGAQLLLEKVKGIIK